MERRKPWSYTSTSCCRIRNYFLLSNQCRLAIFQGLQNSTQTVSQAQNQTWNPGAVNWQCYPLYHHTAQTWEMLGKFILAYIDEILKYSVHNHIEHSSCPDSVPTNFLLKEKCGVPYLVLSVMQGPSHRIHQNVKSLQWFIGFNSFYRWFIRKFFLIAAPLIELKYHPGICYSEKNSSLFEINPDSKLPITKLALQKWHHG